MMSTPAEALLEITRTLFPSEESKKRKRDQDDNECPILNQKTAGTASNIMSPNPGGDDKLETIVDLLIRLEKGQREIQQCNEESRLKLARLEDRMFPQAIEEGSDDDVVFRSETPPRSPSYSSHDTDSMTSYMAEKSGMEVRLTKPFPAASIMSIMKKRSTVEV